MLLPWAALVLVESVAADSSSDKICQGTASTRIPAVGPVSIDDNNDVSAVAVDDIENFVEFSSDQGHVT